ncbi:hypothetical protein [Geodermatophilus sabuli]|uniref:hypothetical protein n=1 Tax=Geodermatophilus sabuli TaxID=1564158 RepID=UPI001952C9C4|nr:hypothetical protein [Geodermatophilus sabuli]
MSAVRGDRADGPLGYEIRVRGHLAARWAAWFDGLRITTEDDGTTLLRGPVPDQAALHGVLQRLRDTGLPLLSLRQVPSDGGSPPEITSSGDPGSPSRSLASHRVRHPAGDDPHPGDPS